MDGFAGPLDRLLALARRRRIDLGAMSVLDVARQCLAFVDAAGDLRIERAADHLVTAAWLADLKSRLLLPPDPEPDDARPTVEDEAAARAHRRRRLDAMREAADALLDRPRLGRDVHARGAPHDPAPPRRTTYAATLPDLLRAYARIRTRDAFRPYVVDRRDVLTLEEALDAMRGAVAATAEWTELDAFLPDGWTSDPDRRRSATAATFAASLELAKAGAVEIRQDGRFGPIALRPRA